MAYRFHLELTVEQNVRQVALEQLDRAIGPVDADAASWVHETRKCLKRVRALLRLLKSAFPIEEWRGHNTALRDAGRLLSARRDFDVRMAIIAQLEDGAQKKLTSALAKLRAIKAVSKTAAHAKKSSNEIANAQRMLRKIRRAVQRTKFDDAFDHITTGLTATHRKGRSALELARQTQIDDDFHELRKAVQTHWRQMKLICEAWPVALQQRADMAKEISQALGDDHDLTMLLAWIDETASQQLSAAELTAVRRECRGRQEVLRTHAIQAAELLFAQKPRRFAEEIEGYWRIAKTQKGAAQ